jgi:hypothetical protein
MPRPFSVTHTVPAVWAWMVQTKAFSRESGSGAGRTSWPSYTARPAFVPIHSRPSGACASAWIVAWGRPSARSNDRCGTIVFVFSAEVDGWPPD